MFGYKPKKQTPPEPTLLDQLSDTPLNVGNWPGYASGATQFAGTAVSNIAASMSPVRFEDADGPTGQAGFHAQVPPMITETAGAWDRLFGEQDNWYDGPGEVYPGDMNADAATAALAFYGGNALNPLAVKPRGSIASGASREAAALPMDPASRLARADEIYRPETVYHGTYGPDFDAFDLGKGGARSGSRAGLEGVSVSPDASVATEFAGGAFGGFADGSRVLPLRYRSSRQARLELDGTEKNNEVAATLSGAWENGYDSVVLNNYSTPGGMTGQKVIVVQNPNQLRSVNAAFDPARINESGLLLSDNKPSIMGMAAGTADNALPMDHASRMARADEMGFDTSKIWYHGTDHVFDKFDNAHLGKESGGGDTGNPMNDLGHFFTDDAEYAAMYGENINPVYLRGKYEDIYNPLANKPEAYEMVDDIARRGQYAKLGGQDGVTLTGPGTYPERVVFDPSNIRSVNAAFDPARAGENGLLLSDNKPSILGGSTAPQHDPEQARRRNRGLLD